MTVLYTIPTAADGGFTNLSLSGSESKIPRVVTATGAITMSATDRYIIVKKTTGAATTINLIASPATGRIVSIKDGKGDAAVNNITIAPATGSTIDGANGVLINTAYGGVDLVYNGTEWSSFGYSAPSFLKITNLIRNSSDVGTVAGTPGTLPANWGSRFGTLAQHIVGTGTDTTTGYPYIDIQFSGTTSQTSLAVTIDGITVAPSTQYTFSSYAAIVAGSTTNLTNYFIEWDEYTDSSFGTSPGFHTTAAPSLPTSTPARTICTGTTASNTTFVSMYVGFNFTSGVAINVTLRIMAPQFETGAIANAFVATGQAATSSSAPAQAAAAGFNTLAFFDDFTNATTVTGTANYSVVQSGVNWYPGHTTQTSPTNYQVLPTTTAAAFSNGNSGGGSNASANGGILRVYGNSGESQNQGTFETTPLATSGTTYQGTGTFGPLGYWEGYVQYNPALGNEHIAFWTTVPDWGNTTELDIMEQGSTPFGDSNWKLGNLNNWSGGSLTASQGLSGTVTSDANWHTMGILIVATSGGQGTFSVYLDNVLKASTTVGTGTSWPTVLLYKRQFIIGKDWVVSTNSINLDWVKFWSA